MKKTFEQILEIDAVVGQLYKKEPTLKDSKFGYAYNKFYKKNIEKPMEEFKELMQDNYIDFALEDEKTKQIIRDEKSNTGYAYTKEQLKAMLKKEKEITEKFMAKEFEVEPYISALVPEMTEEQKEILTGSIL